MNTPQLDRKNWKGTARLDTRQEAAVERLENGKILWGGVGSGKSITAVSYYWRKEAPKDVYVITTAKKRESLDWEAEFAKYGVGTNGDATTAGKLTVDSWNNFWKYRTVEGAFFIFDEQRLVGAGEWSKVFLHVAKRNHWILLTATPGDTWLDYVPVFLANGFYKNRTEFKREHVVYNTFTKFPKVDRYIGTGKLIRNRNRLLVPLAYARHTIRHEIEVKVGYDKELFERVTKDRWHVYENRPLRDMAESFLVMRKVVNSHPSRLQQIKSLLEKHSRLIVFYNFNYELETLRTLNPTSTIGTKTSTVESVYGTETDGGLMIPVNGMEIDGGLSIPLEVGESTNHNWLDGNGTSIPTCQLDLGLIGINDETQAKLSPPWENAEPGKSSTSNTANVEGLGSISKSQETPESFAVAEWNGHKHEPIPKTDRWVYLVQYIAGSEAWECTETNAMVLYSLNYSYKIWEQVRGRIDRRNTPFIDLYYYTLLSDSAIDKGIVYAISRKKSFNESDYIGKK